MGIGRGVHGVTRRANKEEKTQWALAPTTSFHIYTNPKTPVVCPLPPLSHMTLLFLSLSLSSPSLHKQHPHHPSLFFITTTFPFYSPLAYLPPFQKTTTFPSFQTPPSFLPKQTHTHPQEEQWPLKDQTSSHKPQFSSKSSRGVRAWVRGTATTKMASHSMSQKGILLSTWVKTERGTLSQSRSSLTLSSNACCAELKKNSGSTTTWASLSLVKKSFSAP